MTGIPRSPKLAASATVVGLLLFGAVRSGSGRIPGEVPVPVAPRSSAAADRRAILDLEVAVAQAELVVAVRLVEMTESKIVHGGRTETVTQQYRFEPVRVLKGIFARESLLMTGEDLGIYRFAASGERLDRGQLLLVLLGRQGEAFFNCCTAETLGQSIPRLAGLDDPLLGAVDALIAAGRQRDRLARVERLRDALEGAKGRAASPLLLAIGRRAAPASRVPGMIRALLPALESGSPALRAVAARTLGAVLEADRSRGGPERIAAVRALAGSLGSAGPDLAARVATIDALGSAGADARADAGALERLALARPSPTIAEAAARLRAAGLVGDPGQRDAAAHAYADLPLDAPAALAAAAGDALVRLDPGRAAASIPARLASKADAGLAIAPEIALLATLPPATAAPGLIGVGGRDLDPADRLVFAHACATVADPGLVPALATLLDPGQGQIRYEAEEALMRIDTDDAAASLWPHLDEQANMARKLRLIAFLGRHGFRDGGPQAIEHLSQATLREEAVEALANLGESRAVPELRKILATSNDLAWNAAAIRALARLGQADIAPKLLEIARTPGDPLASSALLGLGDLGVPGAVPIVRDALDSRSDEVVIAAARASARLLARPGLDDPAIRDRLAALASDGDAAVPVREAALDALIALKDARLPAALASVTRDADLEASPFLARAELELKQLPPGPAK